jgi:hypothetical protein
VEAFGKKVRFAEVRVRGLWGNRIDKTERVYVVQVQPGSVSTILFSFLQPVEPFEK